METIAQKSKVLIVDDTPENIFLLMEVLKNRYAIVAAKDGAKALQISTGDKPPDIVLLDIMMPEMDGYEVCRRLKENPATREIPVIFLSALTETGDKVKGLDLGAVDYISKPFQADEVIARINTHLTIYSLRRELQKQKNALEHELKVVADVQRKLLPDRLPRIEGLELGVFYQTSRYAGGDYYDIIALPQNRWGLFIADAEGHSTPAAVRMAMTCALFRAFAPSSTNPGDVLRQINENLCKVSDMSFVTALYAIYEPDSQRLSIARAGHPEPLIYRPAMGKSDTLNCPGVLPLGVDEYKDVPVTDTVLGPGDRLLFYTDGLTERFSPDGKIFDESQLNIILAAHKESEPQQIIEALRQSVDNFAGHQAAEDDQLILLAAVS